MLYLIYPGVDIWNYMLQDYRQDSEDVVIRPLNDYCYRWQLIIRKLFRFSSICPYLLFKPKFIKEIKQLKEGDSILLCDYAEPVITYALNRLVNKSVVKHFWIWNPVTRITEKFYTRCFEVMRKLGFRLSTFDEADAEKYNMTHYNQFFRMKEMSAQEEIYDFYFIGYAKDREEELLQLKKTLEDKGFKTLFIIVHNQSEAIPYEQSIQNILKSKCIVEYVQHNQSGMTLRPLEAMCFGKKLITNNRNVEQYDYYNGNIKMFTIGDLKEVDDFMNRELEGYDHEVSNDYSVDSWINNYR